MSTLYGRNKGGVCSNPCQWHTHPRGQSFTTGYSLILCGYPATWTAKNGDAFCTRHAKIMQRRAAP